MKLSPLMTVSLRSLSLLSTFTHAQDHQHSYGVTIGAGGGDGFAQAYLFLQLSSPRALLS